MTQHQTSAPAPDRGRIPGPRGWPLWRWLARFAEQPHDRLVELALEYGDIIMLDFKTDRVVILAKPEYVEHVLHHRPSLRYANAALEECQTDLG